MTAGVTFSAIFVDVDVIGDGGGHILGHYCYLEGWECNAKIFLLSL
jgi:hypothetical protein